MRNSGIAMASLLVAASSLLVAAPALAQSDPAHPAPAGAGVHGGPWHPGPGGFHAPGPGIHRAPAFTFTHRSLAQFTPVERQAWVGGRWDHGWHRGRYGWWWFVGGAWYFYDEPIYPYPAYVSDYYVGEDEDQYDSGPGNPGSYWYYCSDPPGYYPYIQSCGKPWQPVPPVPPPGSSSGAPPGYQGPDNGPGPDGGAPPDSSPGPASGPPDDGNNQPPNGYSGPNGNGPM